MPLFLAATILGFPIFCRALPYCLRFAPCRCMAGKMMPRGPPVYAMMQRYAPPLRRHAAPQCAFDKHIRLMAVRAHCVMRVRRGALLLRHYDAV